MSEAAWEALGKLFILLTQAVLLARAFHESRQAQPKGSE